jgi:hypothetical protein
MQNPGRIGADFTIAAPIVIKANAISHAFSASSRLRDSPGRSLDTGAARTSATKSVEPSFILPPGVK